MAAGKKAFYGFGGLFPLLVVLLTVCSWTCGRASQVETVTDATFDEILTGDWMLEFYAPWCPACKQFSQTWESLAEWAVERGNGVRVGKVDVTAESGLSGQFMITQLPTIFHIHDGEVRPFSGSRALIDLKGYVTDEEWKKADPLPWWRSPTSRHMKGLAVIYWLSQKGKELQTTLEQDYQLPTYTVFGVIAVATILIGLTLGGITVCFIELCIRFCSRNKTAPPPRLPRQQEKPRSSPPRSSTPQEVGGVSETKEQTDNPEGEETMTEDVESVSTVEPPSASEGKKPRKRKGKKGKKGQDNE